MDAQTLTKDEIDAAINRLVELNRLRCFWFAPGEYLPANDVQRLRALDHIERHGDREAFMRARELRDWLSHHSNGK